MTDLPPRTENVPARLGATAHVRDGGLVLELRRQEQALHHGATRASVLAFVVDAAAGVPVDQDPEVWMLTTDLSVRMRPVPAPARIEGLPTVVRQGRRSVLATVELVDGDTGELIGTGAAGFAAVARRPGDPPKPIVTPELLATVLRGDLALEAPLREEARITVLDAAEGVVEIEVSDRVRNPAGTLQGAMVALVGEAATEDLVRARFGVEAVVTELDIRYLARSGDGPVRSKSRLLGDRPDSPVEVVLTDTSTDTVTTLLYARATPLAGA